jgi:hypothetical protein
VSRPAAGGGACAAEGQASVCPDRAGGGETPPCREATRRPLPLGLDRLGADLRRDEVGRSGGLGRRRAAKAEGVEG